MLPQPGMGILTHSGLRQLTLSYGAPHETGRGQRSMRLRLPAPYVGVRIVIVMLMAIASSVSMAAEVQGLGQPDATSGSSRSSVIVQMIAQVRAAQDPYVRGELARMLLESIGSHKDEASEPRTIDDLAALLDDPLDYVRSQVAQALGELGPPASRASPLLVRALKRAEAEFIYSPTAVFRPGYFSGDAICEAFEQIGATPPDIPCTSGAYVTPPPRFIQR